MGRPAKSPQLQAFEGLRGHRPLRNTPSFPDASIAPLPWLDATAAEVWSRLAPGLIERKLLTEADLELFGVYCTACSDFEQASRMAGKAKDPETYVRLCRTKRSAGEAILKIGAKFALNPVSRNGLDIPVGSIEPDEFDLI